MQFLSGYSGGFTYRVVLARKLLLFIFFVLTSLMVKADSFSAIDSPAVGENSVPHSDGSLGPAQINALKPLYLAWEEARQNNKSVMLVLGAEWCDRCALLSRYLEDSDLKQRVASRFVMLPMDVGSPDSLIEIEDGAEHLPIILLIDANMPFKNVLQSSNLLTFLPEPYEPVFDWFENVLFFTEKNLAVR